MRRRELVGAVIAAPLIASAAAAQPKARRIGFLMTYAEGDQEANARARAFEKALAELGWTVGGNLQIDYRWAAGDPARYRKFAEEIVALQPDLVIGATTPAVAALQAASRSVPIVFIMVSDPVGSGLVPNIARPGGNITGLTNFEPSLGGKWLELVRESAPSIQRIGFMLNPDRAPARGANFIQSFESSARTLGVTPTTLIVQTPSDIERTMTALSASGPAGLAVMPDAFTQVNRAHIIALAARLRLPTIYPYRFFAAEGGLMSYGTDALDLHRRLALPVDRLLRGTKASDLPVQGPVKFEMVINFKTAKAFGLNLTPTLMARADDIIE